MFNVLATVQYDFLFIFLFISYGFLVLLGLITSKSPRFGIAFSFLLPWVTFAVLVSGFFHDELGDIGDIILFLFSIILMAVGILYSDLKGRIKEIKEKDKLNIK